MLSFPSAGAGIQHTATKGLPERSDAVGDAVSGRVRISVAGQRPQGQNRERIQVRKNRVVLEELSHKLCPSSDCIFSPLLLLLHQSVRVPLYASPVRAGGRRSGDVRGRRAERRPVSAAGPHPDRRHVPRQEEGQTEAVRLPKQMW